MNTDGYKDLSFDSPGNAHPSELFYLNFSSFDRLICRLCLGDKYYGLGLIFWRTRTYK